MTSLDPRRVCTVCRIIPGEQTIMAMTKFIYSSEYFPSRNRFSRDDAFPRAVRGPVDFFALRRLAASRAGARVGDFRSDMAGPTFPNPSIVYYNATLVKYN